MTELFDADEANRKAAEVRQQKRNAEQDIAAREAERKRQEHEKRLQECREKGMQAIVGEIAKCSAKGESSCRSWNYLIYDTLSLLPEAKRQLEAKGYSVSYVAEDPDARLTNPAHYIIEWGASHSSTRKKSIGPVQRCKPGCASTIGLFAGLAIALYWACTTL